MFRKIATTVAAGVLALSGLVALSAPAQASEIQCPPGFTWDAHNNAKQRGTLVDEYWLNNTAVVIYRVDNRYEAYVTNGYDTARACYNKKPDRPKDARNTQTPKVGGGGSGSAYAPGYGGPGINLYPFPSENKGTVTVGPVESVS